jgi:hypothetical protein
MLPSPPATAVVSAPSALAQWIGTWARPSDTPSKIALGLAVGLLVAALIPGGPRWIASSLDFASLVDEARKRRFLTVAGFVAAFLSLGFIAFYLHGGPRSPEAAAYWLQGRALAHGELSWTVPEPSANFRARDLLFAAPDRVAGIFPPGFAVLLAPAFLMGAPMLVGPLLAAGVVVATWLLARELAMAASAGPAGAPVGAEQEMIGRVAAGLSILSAALRYHTADALPYGAAALALTVAVACALRARRTHEPRLFAVAGLALGFLVAAQPATAVPAGAVIGALAWGASRRARALSWTVVAALPGVLLLLAANRAAVGHVLASPASAYASAFGGHDALAPRALAAATLRGLREHLADVDNLEPLALLALVPLFRGSRRGVSLVALVLAGQLAVSVLTGVTSGTPIAGARMLVPALPIEHALMALALARVFPATFARATLVTFALALAGFAVHVSNDHARRANADTGHPHYEPDVAREGNVTHGLLFFEDDEGFELAFDPGVPASHGVQAVRLRGDDHDRILYDSLGHPAIHKYVPAAAGSSASVPFWSPPGAGNDAYRFEAESDWPPVALTGGRAVVRDVPGSCASEGHVLQVTPSASSTTAEASVTIALPVPRGPTPADRKSWNLAPRIFQGNSGATGTLSVVASLGGPALAEWTWQETAKTTMCVDLPAKPVELGGDVPRAWLVLKGTGGPVALDKTTLKH